MARHNGWNAEQRLPNLYFSLEGIARHWFKNHEASLTSWDICANKLKRTFSNQHRRQNAEDLLQTRTQAHNESVTSYVEEVLRLRTSVDPQTTEEGKLRFFMRGVKSDIFGGLVRSPSTTVSGLVAKATNIERALSARAVHYQRLAGLSTVLAVLPLRSDVDGGGIEQLRQIILGVVQEKIGKVLPTADYHATLSLTEIVREEMQRAFQTEAPVDVPPPEKPALS